MEEKDSLMMSRNDLKHKGILEWVQAGHLRLQEASERMGLSYRQAWRGMLSVWR